MAKSRSSSQSKARAGRRGEKNAGVRPTWEGHLKLSLVTCPVTLYTATDSASDVHFHLINPETNNRIRMQTIDAGTGKPVERADLVKGFEIAKNKYVLFEKDELDAVKLESTRVIDIVEFVDASAIDRIYWDQPYYLAPSGRTGVEAYAVIRAAMERQEKVGLGRLVLHQRERICALEPRGRGMLLTLLRAHEEIRAADAIFDSGIPKPDPRMLEIAEKIVEQQAASFDPTRFQDRYDEALRELIERKAKGEDVVSGVEPEAKEDNVVDLMEALKQSLAGSQRAARSRQARRRAPTTRRKRSSRRAA